MTSASAFSFINGKIHSNEIQTHNPLVRKRTLYHLDMAPQPFIYAHYASTIYIWPFRYDTQPSCHLYFRYGVDTIECGFTKTHAWHDNNMQYNSCIWTERQISCQGFYLWVFSILHSIKRLITKKKLSQYKGRNNYVDLVLKTC